VVQNNLASTPELRFSLRHDVGRREAPAEELPEVLELRGVVERAVCRIMGKKKQNYELIKEMLPRARAGRRRREEGALKKMRTLLQTSLRWKTATSI
jgi:hypothetical protein